ncbi:MAG: DUF885 family protein, partial [Caulobacteraceae bacterium]|nr:DUF885 family protein [Caulobacteraceae bacterium]
MPLAVSRRAATAMIGSALLPGRLPAAAPASAADATFQALAARWLEASIRHSPISATLLGDHRFDDRLDDLSAESRAAMSASDRALLAELEAIDRARLSRPNQIDAALLENSLRQDLWTRETLRDWSWDPLEYNRLAGDALYGLMARDFAPVEQRLASATRRMEGLPAFLAQARANLDPPRVPRIHADTVARQNKGLTSLVGELIAPQAKALGPGDRARLDAAATGLARAVAEHQAWIEGVLVPNAHGDFRLGPKLYDEKLAFVLQSPLRRQEIRRRAEAAVIETRARMYALACDVLANRQARPPIPDHPTAAEQQAVIKAALDLAAADRPARSEVMDAARAGLARATAFVRAKDLISLPDAPVQVIVMPEFQQGVAVAY